MSVCERGALFWDLIATIKLRQRLRLRHKWKKYDQKQLDSGIHGDGSLLNLAGLSQQTWGRCTGELEMYGNHHFYRLSS